MTIYQEAFLSIWLLPKASSEATTVTKNSGWKVSAAEIEGGEFAAARAARDERKLARKADVPRTRYHLAIHFRFPPNRTWLWKCATAPSRIPPLSKILQEFPYAERRQGRKSLTSGVTSSIHRRVVPPIEISPQKISLAIYS